MKYVIIGNSAAAIGAVEGIRQIDAASPIVLISKEPHHTYSRPLISYLLWGKTDEQRMKYRPDDFYEVNHVQALLGRAAASIDAKTRAVILEDGERIPYDKLLLATGSTPFVPPMTGLEKVKRRHAFLTLDDAKALECDLTSDSRVLIVGAGLIGMKCAEGIRHLCKEMTIVDLAPRVLPAVLDETGSAIVQKQMEAQGISFRLADSVAEFTEDTATLKSGEVIPFDVLVLAVGVRPNTALAESAGCEVRRGIVTDQNQQTTMPDLYAAGDCTLSHDLTSGQDKILALLPNAYLQGETAGISMAGGAHPYDKAMPVNAGGFFGLHIATCGDLNGESFITQSENSYKRLVVRDNRLVGFILIGDIARAGIYTSLVREQTPLNTLDFDLIREKPQLMAFGSAARAQKLGGAKA